MSIINSNGIYVPVIKRGSCDNSLVTKSSLAADGYSASIGFNNVTVPFEKDQGITDYSANYNIEVKVTENSITFSEASDIIAEGVTAQSELDDPIVLYLTNQTPDNIDVIIDDPIDKSYHKGYYECDTDDQGRLVLRIYSPYFFVSDHGVTNWCESVSYKVVRKVSLGPVYLGFRYWSLGNDGYIYVTKADVTLPYTYDVSGSDINKDIETGKHYIDINYVIPKGKCLDYAPSVFGFANVSGGFGSTTSGYRNVTLNHSAFTAGYHNKNLADAGAVFGANNVNHGNASFVGGNENTVRTGNTIVHGSNNIVETKNSDSAFFGHNNIAEENNNINTSNLCAGRSNRLKPNTRSTAIFGTSNIVDSTNSLVSGYENTVDGKQNIVGGYNNKVTASISIVSGSNNNSQSTASATFGNSNTNAGNYALVAGNENNGSGESSVTLGLTNTNKGKGSFVVGESNVNNNGGRIIVAGRSNTIEGIIHGSAIFGCNNIVKDASSFISAESAILCSGKLNIIENSVGFSSVIGHNNTLGDTTNQANIQGNAVFGGHNKLVANYSFIAGSYNTILNSDINNAFVAGMHCYAGRSVQRVFGKYNIANTSSDSVRYVDIVGWGSESAPKNIYTLDTNGNANFLGTVRSNATLESLETVDSKALITKQYADKYYINKITTTNDQRRAYIVDKDGHQALMPLNSGIVNDTLVVRDERGRIKASPSNDELDAVVTLAELLGKGYLKRQYSPDFNFRHAYIIDKTGSTTTAKITTGTDEDTVVMRTGTGTIQAKEPTELSEVTTVRYVNNKITELVNNLTVKDKITINDTTLTEEDLVNLLRLVKTVNYDGGQ